MRKIQVLGLLGFIGLVSCAPANVITAKWDSGVSGVHAQTRCEQVDMRDEDEMNSVFSRYDGWKLIYISEYTTSNRFGTDAAVCFERAEESEIIR